MEQPHGLNCAPERALRSDKRRRSSTPPSTPSNHDATLVSTTSRIPASRKRTSYKGRKTSGQKVEDILEYIRTEHHWSLKEFIQSLALDPVESKYKHSKD